MSTRADLVEEELPGQKRMWQKYRSNDAFLNFQPLTPQPSPMFLFILYVCVNSLKH